MAINGFDIWENRVQLVAIAMLCVATLTTDRAFAVLGEPQAAVVLLLTAVACVTLAFLLYEHNPARKARVVQQKPRPRIRSTRP